MTLGRFLIYLERHFVDTFYLETFLCERILIFGPLFKFPIDGGLIPSYWSLLTHRGPSSLPASLPATPKTYLSTVQACQARFIYETSPQTTPPKHPPESFTNQSIIHQSSINHSINQSIINRSINQSIINRQSSINQSIHQSINPSINQSIATQSINQWIHQSSINHQSWINQPWIVRTYALCLLRNTARFV